METLREKAIRFTPTDGKTMDQIIKDAEKILAFLSAGESERIIGATPVPD